MGSSSQRLKSCLEYLYFEYFAEGSNPAEKNSLKFKNAVIIVSLLVSLFLPVHNWRNGSSNHILVTNAPKMQDYSVSRSSKAKNFMKVDP